MANKQDYVALGLYCSDICGVLDKGLEGRPMEELNQSVLGAIGKLTAWAEPQIRTPSGTLTKIPIAG
jgi:hypothetical protein